MTRQQKRSNRKKRRRPARRRASIVEEMTLARTMKAGAFRDRKKDRDRRRCRGKATEDE